MLRHLLLAVACLLAYTDAVLAQDAPLPPEEAARQMTVPEGFRVSVFAAEPDVVQPLAMAFDDRGRLWVVECLSYPNFLAEGQGQDRVLIFEDQDGDGRADRRTVFLDNGTNLTSIELGFGGVWLCSAPNLIFVPDRNGDDVPDGPPETLLDGWDVKAKHNVVNGLTWGPDGWLYGCNGILSNSLVGRPGTPAEKRVPLNCGVWRYHPTRQEFEVVAHGTTNPWGIDFDEYGELFITNCVIKHLFHVIPGAHYERMFGQDINPYSFDLIPSCADHIHWAGGYWDTEGVDKPINDAFGGGHAHCGTMIYLGDNWPEQYRDTLFTVNIHGRRLNNDRLERHGSGYIGTHAGDPIKSADPWFRGVALRYGPDGGVYLADWSDTGECHDYEEIHRETGRIFKITYGQPAPVKVDVASLRDWRVVELLRHKNDWQARHALRVLQERAAAGTLENVQTPLLGMLDDPQTTTRLRALWAQAATGGLKAWLVLKLLDDADEDIRSWTARLALQEGDVSSPVEDRLRELASSDRSPRVRLALASGLQRLPVEKRSIIGLGLVSHSFDADDANLPLMIWYGIEPRVAGNEQAARYLLTRARIPSVRRSIARRMVLADRLADVVHILAAADDDGSRGDILWGIGEALHGRRRVPMPDGWQEAATRLAESKDEGVRRDVLALSAVFGDAEALAALRGITLDPAAAAESRAGALTILIEQRAADLASLLLQLLDDPALRGPAIRGLAALDDAGTPAALVGRYASLTDEEKADAVSTLASRPAYALALLDAIEQGTVARDDLSAFTARQLLGLNNQQVSDRLAQVWGTIRPAAEAKAELMARYKALLTRDSLAAADTSHGRAVFTRRCAACHTLFGTGGRIGPELTGAQRTNLDYVLENLLDPSAVVPRDYQVSLIETTDGRLVTGIVKAENDAALTIQTANEIVVLPKDEIEDRRQAPLSMMPEGILSTLVDDDVRDLVSYLASPSQPPLPVEGAATP